LRLTWGVFVVPIAVTGYDHVVVFVVHSTRRGRPSALVEFCRGSEVGLFDWLANRGCRLVDAERKLHTFDGAGEGIMASFAVALFLDGTFADHVGRMVAFEVGSLELFDAPAFLLV